ncbi:Hsp70-Hsp90 organizing protein 3 [Nosema granulosis]|uniref:Hsp70-Hsp90 organizing protein 3 n=1 Tax=Nosema granulosis TaxID=83296 RepID=A0A9P6KZD9_9MICR|nr:Hsp70-Hsp90 organizing protein 3 [Nosema granulosis]
MKHEDIVAYIETKKEYLDKTDFEMLSKILERMHVNEKKKLEEIKEKGDLEFRKGNYKEACELYTSYLAINKENHIIWSNRSAAYHKMAMTEESIEDCKEGLRLKPTFAKFYLRLGVLSRDTDIASAISYFERGLEVDPQHEVMREVLEEAKQKEKEATIPANVSEENLHPQAGELPNNSLKSKEEL